MRHAVLVFAACSAAPTTPHGPALGEITGLAWDRSNGAALGGTDISANGHHAKSDDGGVFDLAKLAPGHYHVVATHDTRTVSIDVDLPAGDAMFVKLPFAGVPADGTPPEEQHVTLDDPSENEITRYHSATIAANAARIEGFVVDTRSHAAVTGGVVTAVGPAGPTAAYQTVSDETGRFRFDVSPGTYVVSAYYIVSGRGQIEVRRSDIAVAGGEAVVVPLLLDTAH